MTLPLCPKQMEFVLNSTRRWNIAHGSVRSGKTICTLFRFMQAIYECPDSQIWMVGHTSKTIYDNAIRPLFENEAFAIYKPFCTWFGGNKMQLRFMDKTISVLGAKDSGAIGQFQGKTMSLVYCDEMTLYPNNIIQMIDTRLSNPHSMGFASMNPTFPSHQIKTWIDMGEAGDKQYYSLHFNIDDNTFLPNDYKERIKKSLSGVFYKRNYLGLWCLAEGAIFDFFDKSVHVVPKPPRSAEYWIAGIDYGTVNSFSCVLIGINSGKEDQTGVMRWVEKEYVWDSKQMERQKTNFEYINDVEAFLGDYSIRGIYVDPSAASFKLELKKKGFPVFDANNDVQEGIRHLISEMQEGKLVVCKNCTNLTREIESYVWDKKSDTKGEDVPLKKDDHSIDAMRYAVYTHKVSTYDYKKHNEIQKNYMQNRFGR